MIYRHKWAILLLLLCFAPGALGRAGAQPTRVLCSFYPMYVMTLNVVGDTPDVEVECMTEPFVGCLHDYQLTTANLKALTRANIFVANGGGMETFAKAVEQSPHLKIIEASRGMKLAFDNNPHIWVSVGGAMGETKNIAQGLAAADPAHASDYERNAAAYVERLEKLRAKMHAALDEIKGRKIITFHEAFPYFASELHLDIVGVVEREPGSQPSAGELAKTIELARRSHVNALFAEPQYPSDIAEIIHRETGVPVSILDPAVTGPREPAQARDSYIETMERNLKVLVQALSRKQAALADGNPN